MRDDDEPPKLATESEGRPPPSATSSSGSSATSFLGRFLGSLSGSSPEADAGLGHRAEHGLLLIVQAVALWLVGRQSFAFGSMGPGSGGFPLDDAWIHQVVARTFAETGTLGYEPGRFGSGATSYAWAALLALNFRFVHASPALFAALLGALCYVATGQLLLACLRRDGLGRGARLWIAALFSCAANGVWFALSGMEASLLCALSMFAIFAWNAGRERPANGRHPRSGAWLAGLACGAVAWTRPEAMLLAPLLLVTTPNLRAALRDRIRSESPSALRDRIRSESPSALRNRIRSESPSALLRWTSVVALLAPWLALISLYFVLNRVYAGQWFPLTLRGRSWMWLHPLEGASRISLAAELLTTWQERLAQFTLGSELAFWLTLGAAAVGLFELLRPSHSTRTGAEGDSARISAPVMPRFRALVAWALVHLAVFAAFLPVSGHGGRYQPLTPSVFMALAALGLLGATAPRVLRRSRALLVMTLPLVLALLSLRSLHLWGRDHAQAIRHVDDTEVAMGALVAELPKDARIASYDIGGIGFYAHRPIQDLGALVDPRLVDTLRKGDIAGLLIERATTHVVLPMSFEDAAADPLNFAARLALAEDPRLTLVPVAERRSAADVWLAGFRATLHSSPRQVLYRVDIGQRAGGQP